MSIAVTAGKRARGRLFAQVRLSDDAADCRLEASARVAEGAPAPLVCRAGQEEGLWLIMLPSLSVTQVVHLTALSWDGTTVEEQTTKFGPLSARVSNPVSLVKPRSQTSWQLPDERAALGEWDVRVERLVSTQSGFDICQGHADLVGSSRESVEGNVRVRILDARGREATEGSWTMLADETRSVSSHPGFFSRHLEFSLRVAHATPMLVVWVEPTGQGDVPGGFSVLSPRVTSGLREAWRSHATSAHDDEAYDTWFKTTHAASESELAMQREAGMQDGPSISVVCVARQSTPEGLRESVDSVLAQTYGSYEFVLVNAAPNNHRLESAVRGLELADARVRCVPLAADFGEAAATSLGIDAATSDFVCLLKEGDLLAPDALWHVARTIVHDDEADLIYTDQDELSRDTYVNPQLKPDWDPDLLLGYPYLGGLLCVRRSLLAEMSPMDTALDGAEDYRIALYASSKARKVVHVARVLYHERSATDRRAHATTDKLGGLTALRQHLEGTGIAARPSLRVPQGFELTYELPEEPPLVSVIVLNRDSVPTLDRTLTALRTFTVYPNYEVIIVENGSVDSETFAYYRKAEAADDRVRTIFYQVDGSFNEALLINFGVSRAKGELLLVMHNDIEVTDQGWMGRLVSLCLRDRTGAAGARLVRADGTIECCGMALGAAGPIALNRYLAVADENDPTLSLLHASTMVSGSCVMVRKDAFLKVGGMRKECGRRLGVEDLCLRLWGRGYRVVVDPQVSVVHHRTLAADIPETSAAADFQAVGRLWDVWPFSSRAIDPMLESLVDPASAYRSLPV